MSATHIASPSPPPSALHAMSALAQMSSQNTEPMAVPSGLLSSLSAPQLDAMAGQAFALMGMKAPQGLGAMAHKIIAALPPERRESIVHTLLTDPSRLTEDEMGLLLQAADQALSPEEKQALQGMMQGGMFEWFMQLFAEAAAQGTAMGPVGPITEASISAAIESAPMMAKMALGVMKRMADGNPNSFCGRMLKELDGYAKQAIEHPSTQWASLEAKQAALKELESRTGVVAREAKTQMQQPIQEVAPTPKMGAAPMASQAVTPSVSPSASSVGNAALGAAQSAGMMISSAAQMATKTVQTGATVAGDMASTASALGTIAAVAVASVGDAGLTPEQRVSKNKAAEEAQRAQDKAEDVAKAKAAEKAKEGPGLFDLVREKEEQDRTPKTHLPKIAQQKMESGERAREAGDPITGVVQAVRGAVQDAIGSFGKSVAEESKAIGMNILGAMNQSLSRNVMGAASRAVGAAAQVTTAVTGAMAQGAQALAQGVQKYGQEKSTTDQAVDQALSGNLLDAAKALGKAFEVDDNKELAGMKKEAPAQTRQPANDATITRGFSAGDRTALEGVMGALQKAGVGKPETADPAMNHGPSSAVIAAQMLEEQQKKNSAAMAA